MGGDGLMEEGMGRIQSEGRRVHACTRIYKIERKKKGLA
jgi:hypothetical protein